jgi:hypothetical protein
MLLSFDQYVQVVSEDVRNVGGRYCVYIDDKVLKKNRKPGERLGATRKTKSGKIKMKSVKCHPTKKKANNHMAAVMQ